MMLLSRYTTAQIVEQMGAPLNQVEQITREWLAWREQQEKQHAYEDIMWLFNRIRPNERAKAA